MCGSCDPYSSLPILKEYFTPEGIQISENKRGITV
jgi:S-adenosylmethionine/arginine decarboxylase-like enzyme